jgi:lysyl-tRNA synthetase class 2
MGRLREFFMLRNLSTETVMATEIRSTLRQQSLQFLQDQGCSLYPSYKKTLRHYCIDDIENHHGRLFREKQWDNIIIDVTGRISNIRQLSNKLVFYDIERNGKTLQIVANQQNFKDPLEFTRLIALLRRGDIVEVQGTIGKTQPGQLSLKVQYMRLLAPCLHRLPKREIRNDTVSNLWLE